MTSDASFCTGPDWNSMTASNSVANKWHVACSLVSTKGFLVLRCMMDCWRRQGDCWIKDYFRVRTVRRVLLGTDKPWNSC